MKHVALLLDVGVNDAEFQLRIKLLPAELEKLGWTEGQNLQIDLERTGADPQRMLTVAAEAIRRAPDAIVTLSNQMTTIVGRQTRAIPIIFMSAGDPVGTGLVANMAHPGGNMTGFTTYDRRSREKSSSCSNKPCRHSRAWRRFIPRKARDRWRSCASPKRWRHP
jgi:putative ABC transport system substrate-binding protein